MHHVWIPSNPVSLGGMQVKFVAENRNLSRSYATLSVSIGPGRRSVDMARYGSRIQDKKTEKPKPCAVVISDLPPGRTAKKTKQAQVLLRRLPIRYYDVQPALKCTRMSHAAGVGAGWRFSRNTSNGAWVLLHKAPPTTKAEIHTTHKSIASQPSTACTTTPTRSCYSTRKGRG